MKKVVALIAMLSLAFFASCSNEEVNTEAETSTGVEVNTEVTTEEEMTEEEIMEEEDAPMTEEEEVMEEEAPMTDTEGNEVDEEAAAAALEADMALEVLVSEEEDSEEMTK